MESNDTIPYLLCIDDLTDKVINNFNRLKKKEDPNFVPFDKIYSRPELRADKLWSRVVPKHDQYMCPSDIRYVLVPREMVPYVVIHKYDGREHHTLDYNKYGIHKIQEILQTTIITDKLSAIQEVIDKVLRETNK